MVTINQQTISSQWPQGDPWCGPTWDYKQQWAFIFPMPYTAFFNYFISFNLLGKKTHLNCCAIFLPAQQILLFSFGQNTPDNVNETAAPQLAVSIVMNINPPDAFLLTETIVNISVTGGSATCESMISVAHNHSRMCSCLPAPHVFFHLQWVKTLVCLEQKLHLAQVPQMAIP